MKLQINSLEALERLIGGDTSIELELRNNIVQEFTKKHLKGLASAEQKKQLDKVVADIRNDVAGVVQTALGFDVKTNQGYWKNENAYTLNEKQKATLKDLVFKHVDSLVNAEYLTAVRERIAKYRTLIDEEVEYSLKKYSNQMIKEAIEKKLAEKLKDIKIDL